MMATAGAAGDAAPPPPKQQEDTPPNGVIADAAARRPDAPNEGRNGAKQGTQQRWAVAAVDNIPAVYNDFDPEVAGTMMALIEHVGQPHSEHVDCWPGRVGAGQWAKYFAAPGPSTSQRKDHIALNPSSRWLLWYTEPNNKRGAGVPYYQHADTGKVAWARPPEGVYQAESPPPAPARPPPKRTKGRPPSTGASTGSRRGSCKGTFRKAQGRCASTPPLCAPAGGDR